MDWLEPVEAACWPAHSAGAADTDSVVADRTDRGELAKLAAVQCWLIGETLLIVGWRTVSEVDWPVGVDDKAVNDCLNAVADCRHCHRTALRVAGFQKTVMASGTDMMGLLLCGQLH